MIICRHLISPYLFQSLTEYNYTRIQVASATVLLAFEELP